MQSLISYFTRSIKASITAGQWEEDASGEVAIVKYLPGRSLTTRTYRWGNSKISARQKFDYQDLKEFRDGAIVKYLPGRSLTTRT